MSFGQTQRGGGEMEKQKGTIFQSQGHKIIIASLLFLVVGFALLLFMPVEPVMAAFNIDLEQCFNDDTAGLGGCVWKAGNLGQGDKAWYSEGMATGERISWTGWSCPTSSCQIYFSMVWSAKDSGSNNYHGNDFVVYPSEMDKLAQKYSGFSMPMDITNKCRGLANDCSSWTRIQVPYSSKPDFNSSFCIWPNEANLYCNVNHIIDQYNTVDHTAPDGLGVELAYSAGSNVTAQLEVGYPVTDTLATSRVYYTLTVSGLDASGNGSSGYIMFGAHLSLSANHTFNPVAWGVKEGTYPIGGSFWHVYLDNASWMNIGAKDRQEQLNSGALAPMTSRAGSLSGTSLSNYAVTDYLTMTSYVNGAQDILGNIQWYTCYAPRAYKSELEGIGCTSTSSYGHVTVTPASSTVNLTKASNTNDCDATAKACSVASYTYNPTQYGYYCFLTTYNPSKNANGQYYYPPLTDNSAGSANECFEIQAPTAVSLTKFTAESNPFDMALSPAIAYSLIGLGLLGLVTAGVGLFKFRSSRN